MTRNSVLIFFFHFAITIRNSNTCGECIVYKSGLVVNRERKYSSFIDKRKVPDTNVLVIIIEFWSMKQDSNHHPAYHSKSDLTISRFIKLFIKNKTSL